MSPDPPELIGPQEQATEFYDYLFNKLSDFPDDWKKDLCLLVADWNAIAISFTIRLRPFLGLSPKFNQCTRNLNKSIKKELIEKIKVKMIKAQNWYAKATTRVQRKTLISEYLYSEDTGLPLEVYTPEDVTFLAEELLKHVYVQYPDAVENVYG